MKLIAYDRVARSLDTWDTARRISGDAELGHEILNKYVGRSLRLLKGHLAAAHLVVGFDLTPILSLPSFLPYLLTYLLT